MKSSAVELICRSTVTRANPTVMHKTGNSEIHASSDAAKPAYKFCQISRLPLLSEGSRIEHLLGDCKRLEAEVNDTAVRNQAAKRYACLHKSASHLQSEQQWPPSL